jgi:hypothetical protein
MDGAPAGKLFHSPRPTTIHAALAKPTRQRSRPSTTAIINGRSSSDVIPLIVVCHHPPCLGRSQNKAAMQNPSTTAIINGASAEVVPVISACHHPRWTCRAFDQFDSTSLHPKPTGQCDPTQFMHSPALAHPDRPTTDRSRPARVRPTTGVKLRSPEEAERLRASSASTSELCGQQLGTASLHRSVAALAG